MRKVVLLTTALLVCGIFVLSAQMTDEGSGLAFEVSGDATVTFGYNLATGAMGFTNESSSSIIMTLVEEQSSEAGEGDGWHGWIELSDFEIRLESGEGEEVNNTDGDPIMTNLVVTAPGVEAKIINGPIWVRVFENDGMSVGKVSIVEDDGDDDYLVQGDDDGLDIAPDLTSSGGISVGYADDMFSVTGHLSSETSWEDPATSDDGWSVGVDGSVTFGPVTASADVVVALNQDDNDFGAGIGATFDQAIGDTMNLAVTVGVDMLVSDTVDPLIFEFGGELTLDLSDSTSLALAAISSPDTTVDTDLEITFSEDGGMVENVALDILFGMYNLGSGGGDDYLVSLDASYEAAMDGATLTPALGLDYYSSGEIGLEVKATLSGAIPNTEFVLLWETADIVTAIGIVTFATTVSY